MGDTHYGNAMTEVALALAMAFFSIMILTMVSMGAVHGAKEQDRTSPVQNSISAKLAPNAGPESKSAAAPTGDDTLLIYHAGQFFDSDLNPADPANLPSGNRVILALSPETEMAEALQARARIQTENLIVSILNAEWLEALRQRRNTEN
jgi:hypothetical protein